MHKLVIVDNKKKSVFTHFKMKRCILICILFICYSQTSRGVSVNYLDSQTKISNQIECANYSDHSQQNLRNESLSESDAKHFNDGQNFYNNQSVYNYDDDYVYDDNDNYDIAEIQSRKRSFSVSDCFTDEICKKFRCKLLAN